jgi:hypothetical protein
MRGFLAVLLLSVLSIAGSAEAAALSVNKTSAVVSDPLNDTLPLRIPGAVVDFTVTVTNPLANALTTVSGVVYSDPIPSRTALRVLDLAGTGKGPLDYVDGSLLGTGLLGSNLTYSYAGLSSTTDRLDFSNDGGTTWTYVPVPDSDGYDANVTNIRVRLSGNQTAGGAFALRFRVKLN